MQCTLARMELFLKEEEGTARLDEWESLAPQNWDWDDLGRFGSFWDKWDLGVWACSKEGRVCFAAGREIEAIFGLKCKEIFFFWFPWLYSNSKSVFHFSWDFGIDKGGVSENWNLWQLMMGSVLVGLLRGELLTSTSTYSTVECSRSEASGFIFFGKEKKSNNLGIISLRFVTIATSYSTVLIITLTPLPLYFL